MSSVLSRSFRTGTKAGKIRITIKRKSDEGEEEMSLLAELEDLIAVWFLQRYRPPGAQVRERYRSFRTGSFQTGTQLTKVAGFQRFQ